ncbi:MAG: hypothetical protein LUI07_08010 [Lachnospiraceae bacterium]|nr:hypothetical protein [Lachnospiraceae bacterium]
MSDSVSFPQYFVTGVGAYDNGENGIEENKIEKKYMRRINGEQPDDRRKEAFPVRQGMELIVTRQIGLAGTASLVRLHEEELLGNYPFQMVERAKGFDRWMSVTEAARAVNHFGSSHVYCIARGGIFNALWEMAEGAGVGLEVDIKKIPVKQETIEICEYFDVNPYYLYSEGSLLIATEQPEALLSMLRDADISACVIGRTTDGNDRLILNGESRRFLDRPKADELWRISG